MAAAAVAVAAAAAEMTTTVIAAETARTKCCGNGSGDGSGCGGVNGRFKGCVEMAVIVFRGDDGRAAMSVDGGGGNGVLFAVAMTSSGRPCP